MFQAARQAPKSVEVVEFYQLNEIEADTDPILPPSVEAESSIPMKSALQLPAKIEQKLQ